MIEIPLTQGYVALIDDIDEDIVQKFKWRIRSNVSNKKPWKATLYAITNYYDSKGKRHTMQMHRYILNLIDNKVIKIDHKDHNGLNNTKNNLRVCNSSQNAANTRKSLRLESTSIYKGVINQGSRYKTKPWRSKIKVDGKSINLGTFRTEEEAARAYDEAALKYFGEFAKLNFPLTETRI